jgi:hypothetical protein
MVSIVIQGKKRSDFDILIAMAKKLGLTVKEDAESVEKVLTAFEKSLDECKKGKTNKYNSTELLQKNITHGNFNSGC